MGNSQNKCYILDEFQKKHILIKKEFNIYQDQSFIYFTPKKKFKTQEIELFISKNANKNNNINYILNANISLDELKYTKNLHLKYYKGTHYYEVINECLDYKISVKLNLNYEIFLIVIKFHTKDLHKIN